MISGAAYADTQKPTAARLSSSANVTIKQKLGYWVECSYTAVGQDCHYVYMKPKGGTPGAPLQRIKVKDSKLMKKGRYWVECSYTAVGQDCHYVYATRKPKS
jgi:hypothetical protein